MKHFVFIRRDKKLGAYQVPYYKVHDVEHETEEVCRSLKFVSNEDRARAADFALYFMGEFDDIKGEFNLLKDPEKLVDFEDYIPRKEEDKNG